MDRERIRSFEQMKVWQEAHQLVLKVFELTPTLPPEQQEGLAIAMERAAVDIPRTIAEGFRRRGSRNKAHYYNVAQSQLEALRYYVILCRDLKYRFDVDDFMHRVDTVGRMLESLVRSIARHNHEPVRRGRSRGGRHRGRPASTPADTFGEPDDAAAEHLSRDEVSADELPREFSDANELDENDLGTGD